jgi:D-sedoheptulose 7-phosphate isomerase
MTTVPRQDLADLDALYPFLSGRPAQADDLPAQLRCSTEAKARDIIELRRQVALRDGARIGACARDMARAFAAGGRLLTFGNGGSSTDAQDLASLFLRAGDTPARASAPGPGGGARHARVRPLPAFALTNDAAVVTALANDVGFDAVFARQLAALGRRGDVAVGLSTSGNSPNLVRAFDEAHRLGLLTVGIAGHDGGAMAGLDSIDHLFVVASPSVHRIQEAQTTIYHVLWELTLTALAQRGPGMRATTGNGGERP